jgi:uncharacterized protein (DUF3820 family)
VALVDLRRVGGLALSVPLGTALVELACSPVPPGGEYLRMSEPLQRLLEVEMPYGKYKGTLIADLPGNYLNWFAREGFPNGELGRLLALMHEIDHNGLKHLLAPLRAGVRRP